jgi:hypothetical protein
VLGEVAAGRDLPRLSDEEIHIAASLAPDDKGVRLTLAESALRRSRWNEARERIEETDNAFPKRPRGGARAARSCGIRLLAAAQ